MVARDDNGKFAKGNEGGPGRPKKERELRFYEITLSTVTLEDWKVIVEKAVTDARRGDAVARKWLSDYIMGQPVQRTELDATVKGEMAHTWKEFIQSEGDK